MNRLFSLVLAAFLCCSLQNLNAESAAQAAELETKVAPQDMSLTDAERRELEEYVKSKAGVTLPCQLSTTDLTNLKSCGTGIGPNCKKYIGVIVEKCCQGANDSAGACVTNIANMVSQLPSFIPSSIVYKGLCQAGCSSSLCGSSPYIGHSCLYFCDPNDNMSSCFNAMSGSLTPEAVAFIKGAGLGSMPQYTAGSQDGRVPVLRGLCWPSGSQQTCTGGKADCWTSTSACTAAGNGCNADFAKKCCTDKEVCKWDAEPSKK